MKKTILIAIIMASVLVSCNQKNNENATTTTTERTKKDSNEMDTIKRNKNTKMFACSMHPEVQGKLNDTCNKCGMKLTEPIDK